MPNLAALFLAASIMNGLPLGLLDAVCYQEYAHNPSSHLVRRNDGNGNSYGTCQIKLATARQMGFKGSVQELMKPEVNIIYAAKYLKYQIDRYNENYAQAITAYNQGSSYGHGGSKYLARVFNYWVKHYAQDTRYQYARNNEEN